MADSASPPTATAPVSGGRILQFAPMLSSVDEGFWHRLSSLKLDTMGLDQSPIPIIGYIGPCSHPRVSNHLTLIAESVENALSNEEHGTNRGNRNRCPVPGTLYNTNTLESFHALDRENLLKVEAKKILDDILSGKAEEDCSALSRFLVISFADLKKWCFRYWFAFPALVLDPPATLISLEPAMLALTQKEVDSLATACYQWRNSSISTDIPFFLVCINSESNVTLRPLKDWGACQGNGQKLLYGFYDPCHLTNNPGWPLRNFLVFISMRWNMEKVRFFCYREKHGVADLGLSLVGEVMFSSLQDWRDLHFMPKVVGWESFRGKYSSRCISLAESMDPERLAISAADLNLKLMRWRTLPSLNLRTLSSIKCLLLGAGTLGCEVSRVLLGWGVRKITLVDNGRVSMSNPVRQSLYTFEDCLNGGELKAIAAARSLRRIFPAVETEGVALAIPMPGHPVSPQEKASVLEDCKRIEDLIASHDIVFLLTDTRESRWLPALLCAKENKIAITAALGFDSYLVMRHGAGPSKSPSENVSNPEVGNEEVRHEMDKLSIAADGGGYRRLGCYFCNDVVAPTDSISNRTLDQQCTVTRPGLAPIASSWAVEMLVGILHHPDGINAEAEIASSLTSNSEHPLGLLPHQIRGSVSLCTQLTLVGYASKSCTACSDVVVSEYRRRGLEFVLEVINHPTYLEDITGITELMKSTGSFDLDWDDEADDDDDDADI